MKYFVPMIVIVAATTVFAFDCKVSCPKGYIAGCLKSDNGCDCSCREQAKDAKDDIAKALARANASFDVQRQAQQLLADRIELPERTLMDRDTGKQFTIMLKKQ
jgi:hypothetical protein